jgi:hypothetical protein
LERHWAILAVQQTTGGVNPKGYSSTLRYQRNQLKEIRPFSSLLLLSTDPSQDGLAGQLFFCAFCLIRS